MAKRKGRSRSFRRSIRRSRRGTTRSAVAALAGVAIVAVPLAWGGSQSAIANAMGGNWAGALSALATFFTTQSAWFLGAIIPVLILVWIVKKVLGTRIHLSRHWSV